MFRPGEVKRMPLYPQEASSQAVAFKGRRKKIVASHKKLSSESESLGYTDVDAKTSLADVRFETPNRSVVFVSKTQNNAKRMSVHCTKPSLATTGVRLST